MIELAIAGVAALTFTAVAVGRYLRIRNDQIEDAMQRHPSSGNYEKLP